MQEGDPPDARHHACYQQVAPICADFEKRVSQRRTNSEIRDDFDFRDQENSRVMTVRAW